MVCCVRFVIVVEEDKVLKFIMDLGLNRQVNDEDIEAFHDYFDVRLGGSDDSSEDEDETAQVETVQGLLTDSILGQIPTLDLADFSNDGIPIAEDNVVIEIEGLQNDA